MGEYVLFHLVWFCMVTLPILWLFAFFVLGVPFLEILPWGALGAGIAFLALFAMRLTKGDFE